MIEHECTQAKVINQLNNTVFNGGGQVAGKNDRRVYSDYKRS